MGINSFWLFYIEADSILVSLINWGNGRYYIASIGPRVACDINNHQSLITAADESLSSAATSADITEDQEPLFAGLVIPSSWVGDEGKINKSKSDIILPLFKELDLKPSGFMSNDEAIIEEINKPNDFPSSFINIYLEDNAFELSLIYLGKIKTRIKKLFDGQFAPQLIEDCLLELNLESTLPPQIYIYGKADESTLEDIKNFPWVGKKNVETFLHFPDIKLYQDHELINIFFKAITSQMIGGGDPAHQSVPPVEVPQVEEPEELEEIVETEEFSEIENADLKLNDENIIEDQESDNFEPLEEIPFENLGFSTNQQISEPNPEQNPTPPTEESKMPVLEKKSLKFNLPKINFKLPKFKNNILFFIPLVILIILFSPLIFSKTNITLFVTSYPFDKSVNITLDSEATDLSASVIPVNKKTVTIDSSVTIKTTGKKVIGTKATGEITIFNKVEKDQTIPKGTILTDDKNQSFELANAVKVTASSSNLDTGTATFGQVVAAVSASDIGPEYNLSKNSTLKIKDFPETSIVVKINSDFTGGVKNEINAVSQQDKINAESQLTEKLKQEIDAKINQEFNSTNDVIKETIKTTKGKTDLNREIDEETDELTATSQAVATVFIFKPELKQKILEDLLIKEKGSSDFSFNPDSFNFSFKINNLDQNKAVGSLAIKGSFLPKINIDLLKKNLSGKSNKKAQEIIKKTVSRVYDFNIKTNFKIFDILPLSSKNILIDVKTESL